MSTPPMLPVTLSTPAQVPELDAAQAAQETTLRSIHLPTDVNWFPLAPGWWALLVLVMLLIAGVIWVWMRYRRQAFRREAIKLLEQLQQQRDLTPLQMVDEISALLKRVAITAHGREAVAGYSGDRWLRFLDATGKTNGFTHGPGRCLGASRFQPQPTVDAASLIPLCRDWIQKQSC